MPSLTSETHRKAYINLPLVYLKCNNTAPNDSACKVPHLDDLIPLFKHDKSMSSAHAVCNNVTWVPVEADHVIEPLEVSIPTGQLQQNRVVTLLTFGTTTLAVVIIAYFVYKAPTTVKQKGE